MKSFCWVYIFYSIYLKTYIKKLSSKEKQIKCPSDSRTDLTENYTITRYFPYIQRESFRFILFFTQTGRQPKLPILCLGFWLSSRLGKKEEKSKILMLYSMCFFFVGTESQVSGRIVYNLGRIFPNCLLFVRTRKKHILYEIEFSKEHLREYLVYYFCTS
jgi:hypothetical protein